MAFSSYNSIISKYGDIHVHDYDKITLDFFTGELHSYTSLLMHYSSYV